MTSPLIYNITIYDLQSLPLTTHRLTITLITWSGVGWSEIFFDSAYVNETAPAIRSTSTTSTTMTPTSLSSSDNNPKPRSRSVFHIILRIVNTPLFRRSVVAIAVGTTIGITTLVAIVFGFLYYRRTKSRQSGALPRTKEPMQFSAISPSPFATYPIAAVSLPHSPGGVVFPPTTPQSQNSAPLPTPSSVDFLIPAAFDGHSSSTSSPQSDRIHHTIAQQPLHTSTPSLATSNAGTSLNEEQTDFIHTLYKHNVPAPAIAQVINKMVGVQDGAVPKDLPGQPRYGEL